MDTPAGRRALWVAVAHVSDRLRTLQAARTIVETNDWLTAVRIVQRFYPGSEWWLVSCSRSEGGHGAWKFRNDVGALTPARLLDPPNVPGGPMQYFASTWRTDFNAAVQDLARRHVKVPRSAFSWFSPLGQAIAGGWAYGHARPSGKWTGSGC